MITLFTGIFFTLAIFPGIGPQNLNTLSHGIKRNHHYLVATTCVIADGVLIVIGCAGLKFTNSHIIILIINTLGILFISYYILFKVKSLFKTHSQYKINTSLDTKKVSILRALMLTWLNPLVFIDTIIIIGGASSHYIDANWYWFTLGALLGDVVWIYGLVYISSKLSHKLNNPMVWVILDTTTIIIMAFVLYKTIVLLVR